MGCEAECSEPPRRHQPITSRTHGRHVISPLLLPYYLFLVLIFVPTLSIFICYFHRCKNSSRLCEAEGRGQRSAPAAAAAVPRL